MRRLDKIKYMKRRKNAYEFKKAWVWPECVENFIKSKIKGYSLHVCCGSSDIGDIKVDAYVDRPDIIRANMFKLPFENGCFETVICDPPWELPYYKRHLLLWELCRVLKKGGKLIFNCFWWPMSKTLEVKEWWICLPKSTWRNISLVIYAEKVKTEEELGILEGSRKENVYSSSSQIKELSFLQERML